MKQRWKKLLAIGCALSMAMTISGMPVSADELQEELVVSDETPADRSVHWQILDILE